MICVFLTTLLGSSQTYYSKPLGGQLGGEQKLRGEGHAASDDNDYAHISRLGGRHMLHDGPFLRISFYFTYLYVFSGFI